MHCDNAASVLTERCAAHHGQRTYPDGVGGGSYSYTTGELPVLSLRCKPHCLALVGSAYSFLRKLKGNDKTREFHIDQENGMRMNISDMTFV